MTEWRTETRSMPATPENLAREHELALKRIEYEHKFALQKLAHDEAIAKSRHAHGAKEERVRMIAFAVLFLAFFTAVSIGLWKGHG